MIPASNRVINVRGLSGSGKSTAVKNIMALYPSHKILLTHNHRPLVTRLQKDNYNDVIVIGPYDSDLKTTGSDVILYNEQVKLLIRYFYNLKFNVLYEGMILSTSNMPLELAEENIPSTILLLLVDTNKVKEQRQNRSILRGNKNILKDSIVSEHQLLNSFKKVCEHSLVEGIVTEQNKIVSDYFSVVEKQQLVTTKKDLDLFDLKCQFDYTTSKKNDKKKLSSSLFD